MFRRNLAGFIIIYFLISLFSEQKANLLLATAALCFIPVMLILRFFLKNYLYKTAIHRVKKVYIAGKNILRNKNCMVRFIPDESIIVTDVDGDNPRDLYSFTFSRNDTGNINKCWSDICNFFDGYTYLKMLQTYCESFYTERNINLVLVKKYTAPEDNSSQNLEPPEPDNSAEKIIDINTASAQEISALAGLNLIMAKKAVDYRNKNGEFKSEEEFYSVTGVKDFFKPAISRMIAVKKPERRVNNNGGGERIVDL